MAVLKTKQGKAWVMYQADCIELVKQLPSDSMHYSVFSPPFASLYTYSSSPRDLGNCASHDEFFEHFSHLVPELLRIIKPGRCLSFHCMLLPKSKYKDGYIGLTDFRGRLISSFVDAGWIHHSEVVIWKNPVTAMQRTKALGLLYKQLRKNSCMSRQGIPDYLITMRKPGSNLEPVTHTEDSFTLTDWQEYASPVWMDINQTATLQYRSARAEEDERHIAPLQLEVINRALKMWTNPGDTVFSPFAGIGSEGWCAVKGGRRFVGVELKDSYYEQAVSNLSLLDEKAREKTFFDKPTKKRRRKSV